MPQRIYPARVYKSAATGEFSLEFPDVPGCVSGGVDLDQCLINAAQAIAGHFELLTEAGEGVPEPSDLLAAMAEAPKLPPEDRAGLIGVFPITVAAPAGFMRLSISMDRELVSRVKAAAGPMKLSQFLADAAREKLAGARAPLPTVRIDDNNRRTPLEMLAAVGTRGGIVTFVKPSVGKQPKSIRKYAGPSDTLAATGMTTVSQGGQKRFYKRKPVGTADMSAAITTLTGRGSKSAKHGRAGKSK